MIKKTQRKIILVMIGIISLIILSIDATIISTSLINERNQAKKFLESLIFRNNEPFKETGTIKDHPADGFLNSRSFKITLNSSDLTIITYDYNSEYFTEEFLTNFVNDIKDSNNLKQRNFDMKDNIYYLTKKIGTTIFFVGVDFTTEHNLFIQTTITTILVSICGIIFMGFIIWGLSFWMVKPIKIGIARQRQFISDASHELKTPLTIINANIDVLKNDVGENNWLKNIESQSLRMNNLVTDMLSLAKYEEVKKVIVCDLDLSKLIMNSVLPFDALVYEKHKKLDIMIKNGITYRGNEESIKKAITILLDNAIKHSDEQGNIKVIFELENNFPCLVVYNTGCNIKNEEREKVFERFYRGDESRNYETRGNGLGLAIIKTLSEKENWKIEVDSQENQFIQFKIIFK